MSRPHSLYRPRSQVSIQLVKTPSKSNGSRHPQDDDDNDDNTTNQNNNNNSYFPTTLGTLRPIIPGPRPRTLTVSSIDSRTGLLSSPRKVRPSIQDAFEVGQERDELELSDDDDDQDHEIGRGEGDGRDAGNDYVDWNQLSLSDKKNRMINQELDNMNEHGFFGLGRYQWCIFFLCGFGYFLDLCWAQAFGLIAGPLKQELGVSDARIGDIYTSFSFGLMLGAFGWGIAVDVLGRKLCFNVTTLISSIFGLMLGLPSNYTLICIITACVGVGIGGNIPIDATIVLEFLPTNRRFLLVTLSCFQCIGVIASSGLAYFLVPSGSCNPTLPACITGEIPCCERGDNLGWRYLLFTIALITLTIWVVRIFAFTFYESPKFLLTQDRDEDAIRIVYSIARFNRAPIPTLTIEDFRALDADDRSNKGADAGEEESRDEDGILLARFEKGQGQGRNGAVGWRGFLSNFSHLKELFNTGRAIWLSSSMAVAYMALFASFSISGGYLPLLLRERGIETDVSIQDTYRNYIYIYSPGVIATILAGALIEIPRLGRKFAMTISAMFMAVSLFSFSFVDSVPAFVAFSGMQYFFQSMTGALLYAITPDSFPAHIRGSACGFASTVGRLAGTLAPIVAGLIYDPHTNSVVYLAGAAALVCSLSIVTLPSINVDNV